MERDTLKYSIWEYSFGVLFGMTLVCPSMLNSFTIIKILIRVGKLLSIILSIFLIRHEKITKYDLLCTLFCGSVFVSGVINSWVLVETIKFIFRILLFWLYFKMVLTRSYHEQKYLFLGITDYVSTVCMLCTMNIIVVGGQDHGTEFLLGSDNGMANYYFLACLFSSLTLYFFRQNYLGVIQCTISFLSTVIYAVALQVGASILWVMSFAIIFMLYYNGKDSFIRLDMLLFSYICIFVSMVLFAESKLFSIVVNYFFFGKINSIISRIALWKYFLGEMHKHLFFGFGSESEKYSHLVEGIQKWKLIGNNHNLFLEVIYHFGIVAFLIFLMIVSMVAIRKTRIKDNDKILEIFFFLYLIHGLIESGISYSFIYMTIIYYSWYLPTSTTS